MYLRLLRLVGGRAVAGVVVAFAVGLNAWLLPDETQNDEVAVVRLIGAAEESYFRANQRYGTFAQLLQSGFLAQTAAETSQHLSAFHRLNLQPGAEPVAGFGLGLRVASTGTSYTLSLTRRSGTCATGWFTDETRVVREREATECASTQKIAATVPSRAIGWGPPDIDEVIPPARTGIVCPLPDILEQTSKRTQDLVENLQRFSASERIEQIEIDKHGKRRNSTSQVVNYVAQIEGNSLGYPRVLEYRSGTDEFKRPPLADTNTAAFALIFHPSHIGNLAVRCEGLTEVGGLPAWQVHFEESPDPTKAFHAMRIGGSLYLLRFKGRAWITTDTGEVLRIETDLVAPLPAIDLQRDHLTIAYAPVAFEKRHVRLWLPESASLYVGYRGRRYERKHSFGQFQLFSVDTGETVKQPMAGTAAQSH